MPHDTVSAVPLLSPSLTFPSEVTNKLLSEDVNNVTTLICSCAQSSEYRVVLTWKLIWMKLSFAFPHITFLLSIPRESLLQVQMAFSRSGYCTICHKLISTLRKQISSTKSCMGVGERKSKARNSHVQTHSIGSSTLPEKQSSELTACSSTSPFLAVPAQAARGRSCVVAPSATLVLGRQERGREGSSCPGSSG